MKTDQVTFSLCAFEDFTDWEESDRQTQIKVIHLIGETLKNPYSGPGNPQPLALDMDGCWCRNIDEQNRLVYRIADNALEIVACKYH